MKSCSTNQLKNALLAKGFVCSNTHHEMYWFHVNGKKTSLHTYISNGVHKYEKELLGKVKRQIGLQAWDEFQRFVDCPMQYQEYLKLLVSRKLVTLPSPLPPKSAK